MALENIDMDLLRTLVVVYETRSFTKAAQKLFRSQSAISLKIKKLEVLIGQPLLFRRPKDIGLTSAGKIVYLYATEMLKLNDELIVATKDHSSDFLIRFGAPDDYVQLYLPNIAEYFSESGYEVEIVNDLSINLAQMVDDGSLDLALVTWSPGMNALHVSTQSLSWVSSPDFIYDESYPLPLALFPKGCFIRDNAVNLLERSGINCRVAFSSIQFSPLFAAIAAGHALGVLPSNAIPPGLKCYSLHGLPALPDVEIVIKLGAGVHPEVNQFASSLAHSFALK